MKRIDAHQHFWKFDPVKDAWITNEMAVLKNDFMPSDLRPLLDKNNFEGCVLVQSHQSKEHNDFMLALAGEYDFIKGVVGWVDLQAPDVAQQLSSYLQHKSIKGFRHVLQDEKERALMLKPEFKRGIAALGIFNYTYDILIHHDQLDYASTLVTTFPDQLFVIDHIAKPKIKQHEIDEWEKGIRKIGQYENVYCKISGMVTENNWQDWKKEDFNPYIDVVVESFGTGRIMFGSDWPVCLVAGHYDEVVSIVEDYFSSFTNNEQQLFFGGNAQKFYNLN